MCQGQYKYELMLTKEPSSVGANSIQAQHDELKGKKQQMMLKPLSTSFS